jgi:hypothetical protein
MKTSPRDQVNSMPAAAYFKLLAALMNKNPSSAADSPIIGKVAKVGIIPGRDFDIEKTRAGGSQSIGTSHNRRFGADPGGD